MVRHGDIGFEADMKILVVASSLNPESKSQRLADELKSAWNDEAELEVDLLDLKEADLPLCDGGRLMRMTG